MELFTDAEKKRLEDFDYVRFTICDINGIGRCKTLPGRHIRSALKRGGIGIYAGVLTLGPESVFIFTEEVKATNLGNAVLMPLPGTIQSLPWAADGQFKIGEVLCEVSWMKPYRDGALQAACPRFVARSQLKRLGDLGYSLMSGLELEFTAFHRGTRVPLVGHTDVYSCSDLAKIEAYIYNLESNLTKAGVDCSMMEIEGAEGLIEFSTTPRFGIEAADMTFRLKQYVKEISLQKNVEATFLCQPMVRPVCGSLHFNHSLWSRDGLTNFFIPTPVTNEKSVTHESYMSDVLKRWLAGLIKHAPALTALCCPTVNCYRRLGTEWSPSAADWGINDRSRAIRVKVEDSEVYIENRLPTGPANPYIVLAATVAAGISGLQDGESNLSQNGDWQQLPRTLSEALEALENDKVMVKALGDEFISWFCKLKRESEVNFLKSADLDKEIELYLKMY